MYFLLINKKKCSEIRKRVEHLITKKNAFFYSFRKQMHMDGLCLLHIVFLYKKINNFMHR